ncbi:MAG: hypothetical protein LBM70_10585 [Victivallales bacterium]|jgi:predicted DNA-binding protein YlxM (UPF0122 family)|nr:hypothetical protein [Victivallales bacterium]
MTCYATQYGNLSDCRKCKLKRHCRNAGDPPLLSLNAPQEEINNHILESRRLFSSENRMRSAEQDRRYSRADLLEVITFMASLDFNSIELVMRKLEHPELNLSKLAESRGVSRQAIHKMVNKRLAQIPELAAVLTYRKHRNRQPIRANITTFMEEVCRIRKQTQENRLKKPRLASNCLRRLRSSKPSLLSSPMSILKGTAIWKHDSMLPPDR